MQYYTRLQESPSLVTLAMLKVNPTSKVEVVAARDGYGRTVAVRTLAFRPGEDVDAVYICAGDNPVFVANAIVLAHAHNVTIDITESHNWGDGI